MTLFFVYLFLTIPKIGVLLAFISIVSLGLAAVVAFGCFIEDRPLIFLKKTFIVGVCCGFLAIFLPDKQDSYILAGVYTAQLAAESDIGQDVIKMVKQKLQEQIEGAK